MHKILSILYEYMMNVQISCACKAINMISLHMMFYKMSTIMLSESSMNNPESSE